VNWFTRLLGRDEHFVTTNRLGADTTFEVGRIVDQGGVLWRVTRHRNVWISIHVYGKRLEREATRH